MFHCWERLNMVMNPEVLQKAGNFSIISGTFKILN